MVPYCSPDAPSEIPKSTSIVTATLALIKVAGAQTRFLPAYLLDINPIEMMWSKVKALLRTAEARLHDALLQAISQALAAITPDDAKNWFTHCSYSLGKTL